MKENCLDIGKIQAFLDSELSHDESMVVSSHVASCDGCALMLSHAEDESALVFSALEREFDTLVPTQRLWGRINDAIETERREAPFWQKALAFVRVSLASPSLAIAAGMIVVVALFAAVMMNRTVPVTETPRNAVAVTTAPVIDTPPIVETPEPRTTANSEAAPRAERASYRPETRRIAVQTAVVTEPVTTPPANDYMPGEESYVKTIANLNKTVEQKKDDVLRPSQRIAYERDMAVVDDAITKMRKEVKTNPKNESARQVLYTSYQNKIDLLNSVSQKEELMASLR